jgi:hypothetical protein
MVRDAQNQLWLLEVNPRFPAWIHGATIAGHNMSALSSKARPAFRRRKNRLPSAKNLRASFWKFRFDRNFRFRPLPEPLARQIGHSLKHPSGFCNLPIVCTNLNVFTIMKTAMETETVGKTVIGKKRNELPMCRSRLSKI